MSRSDWDGRQVSAPEQYLGDGVYATWDGLHVVLDLRMQDRSRIALEPAVLARLVAFVAACKAVEDAGGGK